MSEFIRECLPVIITAVSAILTAFTSYVVVALKSIKTKKNLEIEKLELEKQKVELDQIMYSKSFIICPDCKRKIFLNDMQFKVDDNSKKEV